MSEFSLGVKMARVWIRIWCPLISPYLADSRGEGGWAGLLKWMEWNFLICFCVWPEQKPRGKAQIPPGPHPSWTASDPVALYTSLSEWGRLCFCLRGGLGALVYVGVWVCTHARAHTHTHTLHTHTEGRPCWEMSTKYNPNPKASQWKVMLMSLFLHVERPKLGQDIRFITWLVPSRNHFCPH